MKRVAVVGCIGAGKSTLARALGKALGLPVVHLDRHWWEDGAYVIEGRRTVKQRTLPPDKYHQFQREVVEREEWVIDGGVDGLELRLERADTVVFLDLPLLLCASRVIRRTNKAREDYPPLVRESWRWGLMLLRWVLWTYPRKRRRGIEGLLVAHSTHLRVFRLRSRRDVHRFLETIANR